MTRWKTYHDLSGALETLNFRRESLRLGEKLLADNRKRFKAGQSVVREGKYALQDGSEVRVVVGSQQS